MLIDLEILNSTYNLNVKNIAHVGVNNGLEIESYNNVFPNSKLILIEPQKKIYERLNYKFKDFKNIKLYNIALGDKPGKSKLNLSTTHNGSASLLNPTLHKKIHPEVIFSGSEEVNVDKFDNLNLDNVNFLNLDTQGYELKILKGASKSLENIDYIISEINTIQLYENSATLVEIDRYLGQFGFTRLITVFWNDECYWGDAFYIKNKLISNKLIYKSKIKNQIIKYKLFYNIAKKIKKWFS